MKTINVHTAFKIPEPDGSYKHFTKGVHEGVSDAHADHWYTKHNSTILHADSAASRAAQEAEEERLEYERLEAEEAAASGKSKGSR